MSDRSVRHETFVLERIYPVSPSSVFVAWADPIAKAQWFGSPEEGGSVADVFEFCVGGREQRRCVGPDKQEYHYAAQYADIVPHQRIIYTYTMDLGNSRISVSLATLEFIPVGTSTRLVITEQGVFLDGLDSVAAREQGTALHLAQLGRFLQGTSTLDVQ